MRSRALIIIFLLTWVLAFAACKAAYSTRAISFAEFRECQEEYCRKVTQFLNTPIDWHVVLDVSGSYLEARDPITENLLLLIRSLPLQNGDSLTIDAFSEVYYEGDINQDVTSEWIQKIKGKRGALIVQSDLEHLFTRLDNKQPFPNEITDIAGLFTGLRPGLSSHTAHHPRDSRLFYVVLTDGFNDPTGKRVPVPLFKSGQGTVPRFQDAQGHTVTFLDALETFVDRPPTGSFRALFLIIDPKPIDWRRGPDSVRKDWDSGMRQIVSRKNASKARFLYTAFWNKGGDPFVGSIKRQIGRQGGVYPCLVTAPLWEPGPLPTATGVRYPISLPETCSSGDPLSLEIPSPLANGEKESEELRLILLASEPRKRDLWVTFRASKANAYRSDADPFEASPEDAYSGWTPVSHPIKVPSFEDDPSFQFPWTMELKFYSQQEQPPFLKATLSEPSFWSSVFDGMSHRGKALIFWAFLSWAFSLLCAWLYTETARMSIQVNLLNGNHPKPTQSLSKFGRKQRVRHIKPTDYPRTNRTPELERLEIRDVDREDLPNIRHVKNDHIVFDIIPIFNVVYHLIYIRPNRQIDPSHADFLESISFTDKSEKNAKSGRSESFSGAFLPATTFWVPIGEEIRQAGWPRLLGPWRKCKHRWSQRIFSPDNRARLAYQATTTIEETWRAFLCRAASVILSSMAFSLSAAAIFQSFSRSHHYHAVLSVAGGFFFGALLFHTIRYWPQIKRDIRWLWVDSFCTFLLHTCLLMGLFSSVFARNSVNRLTVVAIIVVGFLFAVPTYEKLRDRLISSRIKQQQPVNKWDFFLEIFLARLCSW